MADDRDLESFVREARRFLDRVQPRRKEETFKWGVHEDRLSLFHETTGDEEREEAQRAQAWRAEKWNAGFGWITGPEEHGGRGLSPGHEAAFRLLESEYAVPDQGILRVGISCVTPCLLEFGTREQIESTAVAIQRGDLIACQLFSEPDAGSDLANVLTTGRQDGGEWVVSGQKVWTSNARVADVGLALVRTEPAAPKHRGLTMFLVPMQLPGVEVRPIRQLTGGASFAEVFLDEVRVPDAMRIGPVGEGWRVALGTLVAERNSASERSDALVQWALSLLLEMARRSGRVRDSAIRQRLAALCTRVRVAEVHRQRMGTSLAFGGAERAVEKLVFTRTLQEIGELGAALSGVHLTADSGLWGTYAWNRWILGATAYRIGGGTDEILRSVIGEKILGLPREKT